MKATTAYIKAFALIVGAMLLFASCEDEGEKIYLFGHDDSTLVATETDVVLALESASQIVLSITWTKSFLAVSDDAMHAPNAEAVYIQISTSADFSGNVNEARNTDLSRAYTGGELNTIAKNIGLMPDVSAPLYFRVRSSVGANMESKYSNTVQVNVTAYEIDMSIGYILEADLTDSPYILLSPESDGAYTGFIGAVSWYNFWLREGDGVVWGNYPVDGDAFLLASSDDQDAPWNCWFPAPGGCYYVIFDTPKREWSSLYIPALNVTGDIQTELTFDRRAMQWKGLFSSDNRSITIRLSGTGNQYNYSTGTDDDSAIATSVAFAGQAQALTFGSTAQDIQVDVPGTGEFTLVVDLSNPYAWTVSAEVGGEEPEPVYPELFLAGVDDGITGSWTFDNSISLYNEDSKRYAGVVNVNSQWGYNMYIEKDNWGDYYTSAEGDAYSGSLVYQGEGNIAAPPAGLYLIEASLLALTYNLTAVGEQIWIMGMDENYQFDTPLVATGTPGVFSGSITIAVDSPWGLEIQLDDSWAHKFGGSDGVLYYKGQNIDDDIVHIPGTYTVTVDLINNIYSIK